MVLVTDNILFDRKFNNPFVNNLKSIALFSSFCKKKGIPIVLYNSSIGPIDHQVGKEALQKVLDACPLVITRDAQTKDLIENFKIGSEIHGVQYYSNVGLFNGSGLVSAVKEITIGPLRGDYCVDIEVVVH